MGVNCGCQPALAADAIPVAVTCRVLGFSRQAFYAWKRNPVSQRDWDDAHLINAVADIHRDDPAFGYRFIADELPARGITASENRVARLCSQQRIWSAFSKKRGLGRKAGPPVHDDLAARQFTAADPDRVWLTDITEHPTAEGKLYLCAIKDVYSTQPGRNAGGALRQGQPVPVRRLRPDPEKPWPDWIHGPRRRVRRQRRHGILLRLAAEERPGPPALVHPRAVAPGDHHLDRKDLPPPTPATTTRPPHAYQIRDNQQGRTRSLNHPAPESTKAGAVPTSSLSVQGQSEFRGLNLAMVGGSGTSDGLVV
jgi:putative transposase